MDKNEFLKRVNKNGPIPPGRPRLGRCWEWVWGKDNHGYGHFRIGPKDKKAHRYAWELFRGPIPAGMNVLHACDNTSCVNYLRHLFLGTQKENMQDAARKGRISGGPPRQKFCKRGHLFNKNNVLIIKRRWSTTTGISRQCRTCTNEWRRINYAEKHGLKTSARAAAKKHK